MDLQEAIEKRRSIRKFTDYYVTDQEIKEITDAARRAPSWANTQAWEFIVVRDKEITEKIASTYLENNPAKKCTLAASAVIVACARNGLSGIKVGQELTKFSNWFMFDLGMAVQNLCLKAHDLGLGSVVVGLLDHDKCSKLISLPDDYDVVVTVPIGKPAVAGKEGPPRKELADMVYINKFGDPFIKQ